MRATISGSFLPVRLLCTCTPVSWPCGRCHVRPRRPRASASRSSREPGPGPRARSMSGYTSEPGTRQFRRPGPAPPTKTSPARRPRSHARVPTGLRPLPEENTISGWSLAVNPAVQWRVDRRNRAPRPFPFIAQASQLVLMDRLVPVYIVVPAAETWCAPQPCVQDVCISTRHSNTLPTPETLCTPACTHRVYTQTHFNTHCTPTYTQHACRYAPCHT